jgi:citrate lyase beta subunit
VNHPARSVLYVPANSPRHLDWALAAAPDAIVVDLEDGVPAAEKFVARSEAPEALRRSSSDGIFTVLRVNAVESAFFADDLDAVADGRPGAVLLPMGGTSEATMLIDSLDARGLDMPVWSMVERLRDVLCIESLATIGRLRALVIGYGDLCKEMGLGVSSALPEFVGVRDLVALTARRHGIQAIDGVHVGSPDTAAAACRISRLAGLTGRSLYDARHVGPCNEIFADAS